MEHAIGNGILVPTFRRARYLIGRHEYEVAQRAIANGENENDRPVFNESILPVVEAGLVEYVDDGFQIEQGVIVHAAPGHTEGHIVTGRAAMERPASSVAMSSITHCSYATRTSTACFVAPLNRRPIPGARF